MITVRLLIPSPIISNAWYDPQKQWATGRGGGIYPSESVLTRAGGGVLNPDCRKLLVLTKIKPLRDRDEI